MTFSHSDSQGNSGNHHVENAEERRGVRKCIPFFGVLASWLINAYLAWIPEADVLADPSSVDCNQNLCTAACRLVNVKIGKPAPMEDGSLYDPVREAATTFPRLETFFEDEFPQALIQHSSTVEWPSLEVQGNVLTSLGREMAANYKVQI